MQTSAKGLEFLTRHEGVVLKAYRDLAGVWTIGAGLTAASGVVTPKSGMQIAATEADRLLSLALARNYEPAVRAALPGARQHEFDGAVSFHFNTGAIGRATWVTRWHAGDDEGVETGLARWVRAGGKVVQGLVVRRAAEARLILHGDYGRSAVPLGRQSGAHARIVPPVDDPEAIRRGLITLGYKPGATPGPILKEAVIAFQADHDLAADGIVGRATMATIGRALAARRKAGASVGAGGVAAAASQAPAAETLADPGIMLAVAVAIAAVALAVTAWRYRDVVAARIRSRAPRLAAYLRRI